MRMFRKKNKNASKVKSVFMTRMTEVIVSIAAFSIAIGELDTTVQTVSNYYKTFVSEYTDKYDYDKLSKIHVGNTLFYLETLFEKPVVTKDLQIENKTYNVYYYYKGKYLLTVFFLGKRMVAYTVINFKDTFYPTVNWIENKQLGKFSFAEANNIMDYTLDSSAAMTSILQIHDYGRQGFFRQYYYGYIHYAANAENNKSTLQMIGDASNYEVLGDEAFDKTFDQLQKSFKPNMYGVGEIDLMLLRRSIMSELEFKSYFGVKEK